MFTLSARFIGACSLGAAALAASTDAWATCAPNPANNYCSTTVNQTFTTPPPVFIAAQTSQSATGGWDYRYTLSVDNTAQLPYKVTSWLLPVAADAQISSLNAISYSPSGIPSSLTAVSTDAGLQFDIRSPYPLDMPGTNRLMDLAQISFHSAFGPAASASSAITLNGTTVSRTYNSYGSNVTEVKTGVTPALPSMVTVVTPGSPLALSPVPEASTGTLMPLGLAGLMAVARTRRKKPLQAGA